MVCKMTAIATLWQANDGFRPIGALFFEINGIFHYAPPIFIEISKKIHQIICNVNFKYFSKIIYK